MKTSIHVRMKFKHSTPAFLKICFVRCQEEHCPHTDARDFQQTAYTCLRYQSSTCNFLNRTVDAQFIMYANTVEWINAFFLFFQMSREWEAKTKLGSNDFGSSAGRCKHQTTNCCCDAGMHFIFSPSNWLPNINTWRVFCLVSQN